MDKLLLALIALVGLIPFQPEATACESYLIHGANSEVTLDSLTGRYWYYDLVRFSDMTYDEQISEIRTIDVRGFPGNWQMATYADMEELWNHSAEAIFFHFALTRDNGADQRYTVGRYDEACFGLTHGTAYVGLTSGRGYEKTALDCLSRFEDDRRAGVLGAWVVYVGESPTGPALRSATIVPAIPVLLLDSDSSDREESSGSQASAELVPERVRPD